MSAAHGNRGLGSGASGTGQLGTAGIAGRSGAPERALAAPQVLRVEFGRAEDARRVVFRLLGGLLPERLRARAAARVAAELRDAGLLGSSVEEHYSAADLARRIGRSAEYLVSEIAARRLWPVLRDARGYLIPASSVNAWLAEYAFESSTATEKAGAAIG